MICASASNRIAWGFSSIPTSASYASPTPRVDPRASASPSARKAVSLPRSATAPPPPECFPFRSGSSSCEQKPPASRHSRSCASSRVISVEDISSLPRGKLILKPCASMRAGVLDTVLGQPSVALLLAIADAEFQVRVVLVAPAALGADPRAALGRGRETFETLAPRARRGPSAQACEERTATEEHPAEHRGDDAGAHVRGTGGELVEEKGAIEEPEPFHLHRQDEEEKDLVIRKDGREGEEQRQVEELVRDRPEEDRAGDRREDADQIVDVELEASPLRFERRPDRVQEHQGDQGEDRSEGTPAASAPRQEEEGDEAPHLPARDRVRIEDQKLERARAGVRERVDEAGEADEPEDQVVRRVLAEAPLELGEPSLHGPCLAREVHIRRGTSTTGTRRSDGAIPRVLRGGEAHAADSGTDRNDPLHRRRRRAAVVARRAAQERRRGGARLLHEPRIAQGSRGARPSCRAALLVVSARGAGAVRRTGAAGHRRGGRRVLRHQAPRQSARGLGFRAEPSARLARGARGAARRADRALRGDAGAAPAALVGASGAPGGRRVLEKTRQPAPRAASVHAREARRAVVVHPAQSVKTHFFGPTMSSGRTHWSNCSEVRKPSFSAASLRVVPSLCAVLAIFAALS